MADDDSKGTRPTSKKATTRKKAARPRKAAAKKAAPVRRLHAIEGQGQGTPAQPPTPRRNRIGRPRLLNDEVQDIITGALRQGATIQEAAAIVGVTEQAVHNWKSRGRAALEAAGYDENMALDADMALDVIPETEHQFVEFLWAVQAVAPQRTVEWLAHINRHPDWKSKAWLLKHHHPERYGDRMEINAHVEIEVPDPQAALRERLERLRPGAIDALSWEADEDEADEA